jgi:hypothetical protein
MTPAQLFALVDQHNTLNNPEHAKRAREYDDPADLIALAATRIGA